MAAAVRLLPAWLIALDSSLPRLMVTILANNPCSHPDRHPACTGMTELPLRWACSRTCMSNPDFNPLSAASLLRRQHAGTHCCSPPGHQARRRWRLPQPCCSRAPRAARQQAAALHRCSCRRGGASKAGWADHCRRQGAAAAAAARRRRTCLPSCWHLPALLLSERLQRPLFPFSLQPDEALHSIDQGPRKASPSFQDMRNAQASEPGGAVGRAAHPRTIAAHD